MELTQTTNLLRQDLMNLAQIGDPALAEATGRLWNAFDSMLSARLLELAGQLAEEASAELPAGHLEVRLSGPTVNLRYVPDQPVEVAYGRDEDTARITLRLPPALKLQVDDAAARDGLSVNAWVVSAVAAALGRPRHHGPRGSSLSGYGRS
jgi:hypothetical protein